MSNYRRKPKKEDGKGLRDSPKEKSKRRVTTPEQKLWSLQQNFFSPARELQKTATELDTSHGNTTYNQPSLGSVTYMQLK